MSADVYYAREQAIREKEAQIRADERKRIIALARDKAKGLVVLGEAGSSLDDKSRADALEDFANELEAECE